MGMCGHPERRGPCRADQDEEEAEDADEVEESQQTTIDNYTGVSIKVCIIYMTILRRTCLRVHLGILQFQSR